MEEVITYQSVLSQIMNEICIIDEKKVAVYVLANSFPDIPLSVSCCFVFASHFFKHSIGLEMQKETRPVQSHLF